MSQRDDHSKSLGRELIGSGDSLAVERFRQRLLGGLEIAQGHGRLALDLGCGDGLEAVYLARLGWKVEALDLESHPKWVKLERLFKGQLHFRKADVAALGALRRRYDLIFEKDMLHHVPDPAAVLEAVRLLLKPGGRLWVVECNRYNPIFYTHLTLLGGHQHFSHARLGELMDGAGLEGWRLQLKEARVWPWESLKFQNLMNRVQDFIERLPFLRPFLCYHLASWDAPKIARKRA